MTSSQMATVPRAVGSEAKNARAFRYSGQSWFSEYSNRLLSKEIIDPQSVARWLTSANLPQGRGMFQGGGPLGIASPRLALVGLWLGEGSFVQQPWIAVQAR